MVKQIEISGEKVETREKLLKKNRSSQGKLRKFEKI